MKFEFDLDGDGTYETPGDAEEHLPEALDGHRGRHLRHDGRAPDPRCARPTTAARPPWPRSPRGSPTPMPWALIAVYGGDFFDHAPVAGEPATVAAGATRPGVKYEFDLDGDGTYELDNGASNSTQATFSAGTHTVGARITDTRGVVLEPRLSTFVFQPSDAPADRIWVRRLEASAVAGEPKDLTATVAPYSRACAGRVGRRRRRRLRRRHGNYAWRRRCPNAGVAHNTFTYATPGVYEQRVRLTVAGLPTRIFSARIFVGARPRRSHARLPVDRGALRRDRRSADRHQRRVVLALRHSRPELRPRRRRRVRRPADVSRPARTTGRSPSR